MPVIQSERLKALVIDIFISAGVERPIAERTADHLVDANLAGVDSHGVLRVPDYVAMVRAGKMARQDKIEVVREFAATAVWDANWTFGQYTAWRATEAVMHKAQQFGIGLVTVRNSAHIGRLGEYVERAASAGFVGFMSANLQGSGQRVAPHNGRYARLGTNPIAWGIPTGSTPMVLDMSTSVSAEGKVRVKMRRGETLPPGWLLDNKGNPTQNPADLYGPPYGAILTTGGHKGYGLSLVAEALSGILPGGGWSKRGGDVERLENGFAVMAIHIDAVGSLAQFVQGADELMAHCRDTAPVDGASEVLIPNDPEMRSRQRRLAEGIPIEDDTWKLIVETANSLHVPLPA